MRSGLHISGVTIPFLALVIFFSLFSVVPSFQRQWDFHNPKPGDVGYYRDRVRQFSLVEDESVEAIPRSRAAVRVLSNRRWSIIGPFYDPGPNPNRVSPLEGSNVNTRPPIAVTDTLSRSSFGLAPASNEKQNDTSHTYPKTTTALMKGVRALKTFLVRRLDDSQFSSSFSRTASMEAATTTPSRLFAAPSHTTTSFNNNNDGFSEESHVNGFLTKPPERGTTSTGARQTGVSTRLSEAWQQACQTGMLLYRRVRGLSLSFPFPITGSRSRKESVFPRAGYPSSQTELKSQAKVGPDSDSQSNNASRQSNDGDGRNDDNNNNNNNNNDNTRSLYPSIAPRSFNNISTLSSEKHHHLMISERTNGDENNYGNPDDIRGSYMAIIIGLVAGIMWF
ncbi:hypothetical protein MAP00_000266 [Monascus purpureus]|nr:hypothetical protein MAP00_000266 [Monascus purpureus]